MVSSPVAPRAAGLGGSAARIASRFAGDINTGVFDPFEAGCDVDVAREHGAWAHVDGAFGLWAAVSERFAPLTTGIERADSWTTDAHKWLNVPFDSGVAFVRDAAGKASRR